MKDYMKIYEEWLNNPYFDEATKEELRQSQEMKMRSGSAFTWIWNSAPRD